MDGRDEPADPAAEDRASCNVCREVLPHGNAECRHAHRTRIEEQGVPCPVGQVLPPRDHKVGRRGREREGRVQRGEASATLLPAAGSPPLSTRGVKPPGSWGK